MQEFIHCAKAAEVGQVQFQLTRVKWGLSKSVTVAVLESPGVASICSLGVWRYWWLFITSHCPIHIAILDVACSENCQDIFSRCNMIIKILGLMDVNVVLAGWFSVHHPLA